MLDTYSFNIREEQTTETLEAAIAADAIQGFIKNPTGVNTPVKRIHFQSPYLLKQNNNRASIYRYKINLKILKPTHSQTMASNNLHRVFNHLCYGNYWTCTYLIKKIIKTLRKLTSLETNGLPRQHVHVRREIFTNFNSHHKQITMVFCVGTVSEKIYFKSGRILPAAMGIPMIL